MNIIDDNFKRILAKNIRTERKRIGLHDQESLAKNMGVGRAAVSKWEIAAVDMPISTVHRLAVLFGRTPNELMYIDLEDYSNSNGQPNKQNGQESTPSVFGSWEQQKTTGGVSAVAFFNDLKMRFFKEVEEFEKEFGSHDRNRTYI